VPVIFVRKGNIVLSNLFYPVIVYSYFVSISARYSITLARWANRRLAYYTLAFLFLNASTLAEAIMDRLTAHAHRLNLKGESLRKTENKKTVFAQSNRSLRVGQQARNG
jgi:hypothetical protein